MVLLTISKVQKHLRQQMKAKRLDMGLTQKGLAIRSGVPLPTLRKFEQTGLISLESFLKLLMVLGGLERILDATKPETKVFSSIDNVLEDKKKENPQKRLAHMKYRPIHHIQVSLVFHGDPLPVGRLALRGDPNLL